MVGGGGGFALSTNFRWENHDRWYFECCFVDEPGITSTVENNPIITIKLSSLKCLDSI